MKKNFIVCMHFFLFVILDEFLYLHAQTISSLILDQSTSILKSGSDGFLVATLVTGEKTTICNYKFTDVDANVACLTLGYPAQGLSMVNPNSNQNGSVLIGDIACTGSETNINLCISSGRRVFGAPCSTHTMDAYVHCLQNKVAPQISTNVVTTTCNKSNNAYGFKTVPGKENTGFLTYNGYYVCNMNYDIVASDALPLCQKFCNGVSNPLLNMPNSGIPTVEKYVTMKGPPYRGVTEPNCSRNTYTVALQCGPEPVVVEASPNVTCTSQNITATWSLGFLPFINTSLVSLALSCAYQMTSDNNYDVKITMDFLNCTSISTSTSTSILYSYILTRSYLPTALTSTADRNLTISCIIPKDDSTNQNISLKIPSPYYLNSPAAIPVEMNFYTDATFLTLMPSPYTIYDNMIMYVNVSLTSTLPTLRLGLVNCKAATVSTMGATNSTNSLSLISDSCPSNNTDYKVAIYPLSRKNIGFSFQPFIINRITSIYVLCETTKCYVDTIDSNCKMCLRNSIRRKRSAIETETVIQGPFEILE